MSRATPHVAIDRPAPPTPRLKPGTVRRTTTIDVLSPDGVTGNATLNATGRDLLAARTPHTIATATCSLTLERWTRKILDVRVPSAPLLGELVGTSAARGLRSQAMARLDRTTAEGSLLYQLLDDVSGASLVADGFVTARADENPPTGEVFAAPVDICAGFVAEGTVHRLLTQTTEMPATLGPAATALVLEVEPHGWHGLTDLPAHGFRRSRRIDVRTLSDRIVAETHFRDSYMGPDLRETIVHEYLFDLTADRSMTIVDARATAQVLPWPECPNAVGSAATLIGSSLHDLRARGRADRAGPHTCTHLNDVMRSLADVPDLLARASGRTRSGKALPVADRQDPDQA